MKAVPSDFCHSLYFYTFLANKSDSDLDSDTKKSIPDKTNIVNLYSIQVFRQHYIKNRLDTVVDSTTWAEEHSQKLITASRNDKLSLYYFQFNMEFYVLYKFFFFISTFYIVRLFFGKQGYEDQLHTGNALRFPLLDKKRSLLLSPSV